jgi:hypothetical protein
LVGEAALFAVDHDKPSRGCACDADVLVRRFHALGCRTLSRIPDAVMAEMTS